MPHLLAATTLVLLIGMVLTRVLGLRRAGIQAMHFGRIDKSDFLIPPFALLYVYMVFAAAFPLPFARPPVFLQSGVAAWVGVGLCCIGLGLLLRTLASFGASFRVGIDTEHPDTLITGGLFAYSRNPTYVAFGAVLLGEFLILPNWIMLAYLVGGIALFHRQVLREEAFLRQHYGAEFTAYARRVRRYL